jgi:hypothetical protein
MICTVHQILVCQIKKNEMGGACSTTGDRRGAYRVFLGIPEGKRPLGRPRLRWILKKVDGEAWTGLMWLRIGTGGGAD